MFHAKIRKTNKLKKNPGKMAYCLIDGLSNISSLSRL